MKAYQSFQQNNSSFVNQSEIRIGQKIIVILIFCFLSLFSIAQGDSSLDLVDQFNIYRKQVLQEKLYVHTDKNFYTTGEILWFKIYAVDAFFHMPLAISSVAYIEILDKNNKSVLQSKLSMNKGDGSGSLFLPITLSSGNYKFRAYTNWMKNFDADYFFEKTITIINPQRITYIDSGQTVLKYNIVFFPEGGNLVNTVPGQIAFRATDQFGKGMDCKGIVLDNYNDTILSFRPFKFGIGCFSFTPFSQNKYRAVISFPDGERIVKDLPAVYDSGYVMHLEPKDNGQLEISIRREERNALRQEELIYLFIHTRESIKYIVSKQIQKGMAIFLIDSSMLGDGISELTVFNSDKEPVCERLYFTNPKKELHFVLTTDQTEYDCRKKINLDILSRDLKGNPHEADMSIAVYRIDSLQTLDKVSIDNYLWLSSDLTGTVESPGYYFENKGPETAKAMDNLMLTHGWRRFQWEDVIHNKKPVFEFSPEYNGHIISGKIMNSRTGLMAKGVDGFLTVPGTNTQFRNAVSDDNGNIKFEMKNLYGSKEIIVQTNAQQDSECRVDISSPFIEKYSLRPVPKFTMPESNLRSLLYASINSQVQNLYLDSNLHRFLIPVFDTSAFYGEPDQLYILDNYSRFTTIDEIIREYVQGVSISKREGKLYFVVSDQFYKGKFNEEPLILIDGNPVFNIDRFINNFDPLKINKLEVVKRKYLFGFKSFDGILNFTTYKGDLAGYELDPNAVALDYEGLQLERQYYSPVYETEQQTGSRMPDFRNLLYWAPDLRTNILGKLHTNFYASDLPGKYAIVLQGIDPTGLIGSQVLFFNVRSRQK
jgi:hypothetical protein